MPRDLAISNGRLLVMFDRQYRIRDLYFPHVGKENHGAGHAFRFGVWVGGQFSWMGLEWTPEMRTSAPAVATRCIPQNVDPVVRSS
jgi:glucoamylase